MTHYEFLLAKRLSAERDSVLCSGLPTPSLG